MTNQLPIPELSLVVLIGASGMGKSTFAREHFLPTEVVSSDACRAMLSDDEADQSVTGPAFELLHKIVDMRLALGRLTVVDATNVRREDRAALLEVAKRRDVFAIAVVFDLPIEVAMDRNSVRTDRHTPERAIHRQHKAARRSVRHLRKDRFRRVFHLKSADDVATAEVVRERMWTNRTDDTGPFDIIGDIHGCFDETIDLLTELGYDTTASPVAHPDGRRAVFVGDLVDRGPGTPEVLELVMGMVEAGTALCVCGNHENKLVKALDGRKVKTTHGLAESLEQLESRDDDFRARIRTFMDGLVSHYVLDEGRLVVCHAGLPERYHNRSSGRVRGFALYGDTTGETDDFGFPVRYPWAEDYTGAASVVYGHTPVPEAEWINNTICLDTGAVFGGKLTALRWPERELVSVPAHREHYAPTRPLIEEVPANATPALMVDVGDVLGKHHIETDLMHRVGIDAGQSAAALEIMSRFAVDPRWLTYLPPTMAPVQTSSLPDFLEHPDQAFGYFRHEGVGSVMCQEKHMGSRAVITVARTPEAAEERFGITNESGGIITTRTGRAFFADGERADWQAAVLTRLRELITEAGWWDELDTQWLVLDAELLPWSAKAGELIEQQYAPVGQAGAAMLSRASALTEMAQARGIDVADLAARTTTRAAHIDGYNAAWSEYCWPVESAASIEVAPFQLLAAEGEVLARRSHQWHIDMIDQLVELSERGPDDVPSVRRTERRVVALDDDAAVAEATQWWLDMTAAGGEGMVVKPLEPVVVGDRGLVLPGVKCRGREYLRIIYGPEYLEPENLERLRSRGLGRKSSLARREFALGLEGLQRFVDRKHLSQVHQCVFGVLALESEPVDPRL